MHKLIQSKFISSINVMEFCQLVLCCRLDQMFSDAFSKEHQLIRADPKHNLYLACALLLRGNVQLSDLRRNIDRFVTSIIFLLSTLLYMHLVMHYLVYSGLWT